MSGTGAERVTRAAVDGRPAVDATGRRRRPWEMPRDGAGKAGVIHVVLEELDGLATALLGHLDTADAAGRRLRTLERELDPAKLHLVSGASERTLHRILADLTGPTGVARLGRAFASDVEYVVRARNDAAHADRAEAKAYVRRLTGKGAHPTSLRGRLAEDLLAGLAAPPKARSRRLPTTPNRTGAARAPGPALPARKRMGPVRIPRPLARLGNGALPASELRPVGDGERLADVPARAFVAMEEAARREGVDLHVNDGYRSRAEQQELVQRLGVYDGATNPDGAAPAGTSNHGWGYSADIQVDDRTYRWLAANGPRFGFFNDVPGERWHWTYRPAGSR